MAELVEIIVNVHKCQWCAKSIDGGTKIGKVKIIPVDLIFKKKVHHCPFLLFLFTVVKYRASIITLEDSISIWLIVRCPD